ncbi:hypothetical protein [Cloacibacillus sp.]|uniref:hypothetical protein n=1 Tax=Cloacibacillus sp. TaxID=2049023 RepID=UPI0025BA8126|nr:hypothetical protein [Cloacibacillus sp.]MCC8056402.1 hypothetical protein [Cloacibacillus sp.]MCC8178739.1 hypothetical protein [Cloacibacillus sp.]
MKSYWYWIFISLVFAFFYGLGRLEARRREMERIELRECAAREERRRCWNQEGE